MIRVAIILSGIAWLYLRKLHLHISLKSFLKRGFHKYDDDYGLYCYTAEQGGGKTYSICEICDIRFHDRIIISNVESFCAHRKKRTIYMNDFNAIVDFIDSQADTSKYVIFFDEIFSAMGVGGKECKLNKKSRRFLTQLRKRKLHVLTSCQDWSDLPRNFRKLCRYQISCSMFNFLHFGFAIVINKVNDGYGIKWSTEDNDWVCPRLQTNIKKASLATASTYDTYETIINSNSSLTNT